MALETDQRSIEQVLRQTGLCAAWRRRGRAELAGHRAREANPGQGYMTSAHGNVIDPAFLATETDLVLHESSKGQRDVSFARTIQLTAHAGSERCHLSGEYSYICLQDQWSLHTNCRNGQTSLAVSQW